MDEHDVGREQTDRAFEGLYRRHRVDVYRAAMRRTHDHHEAEDVTQAAFLDAYRAVLRGTQPELPRAWLLAIAENVRRRRFAASIRGPRPAVLEDEATASRPVSREDTEDVLAALRSLPENQRSAFVLREVAGLSYAEIADQLDVSLPAVQMLLFRARQGLRALLAPAGDNRQLYAPAWLAWLPARLEGVSVGLRAIGAAGTAVVVLAGVSAASPDRAHRPAVVPPPAFPSLVSDATKAARRLPRLGEEAVRITVKRPREVREPGPVVIGPAVVAPAPPVVEAGPAAPSAVAPAAASESDGRPAPALVPIPTTLKPAQLAVPVPEAVTNPVPELPSVEAADLPALEVPAVPDVPVEVGGTTSVLPGS